MNKRYYCIALVFISFFILSAFLPSYNAYAESSQSGELQPKELFQQGKEYYLDQRFSAAEILFRKCVDQEPENVEYICWLAQSMSYVMAEQAMQGTSKIALMPIAKTVRDLYYKAIEIDPLSERARIGYAILMRDIPGWLGGDLDKAEKILHEMLKENSNNIFVLHHLGNLYIKKRDKYEKGLEYLKRVVQIKESQKLTSEEKMQIPRTYHAIGKTYLEHLENYEKAVQHFEKSLSLDKNSIVTMLDLTEAYRLNQQKQKAQELLRKAAEIVRSREYERFSDKISSTAKKLDMEKEIDI